MCVGKRGCKNKEEDMHHLCDVETLVPFSFSFKTKEKQQEVVVESTGYFVSCVGIHALCSDQHGSMVEKGAGEQIAIDRDKYKQTLPFWIHFRQMWVWLTCVPIAIVYFWHWLFSFRSTLVFLFAHHSVSMDHCSVIFSFCFFLSSVLKTCYAMDCSMLN